MRFISTFTLLTLLMCSCAGSGPGVDFGERIPGRTVNLSNKVGDSLQILRYGDTVSYTLRYDKQTDLNYMIRSGLDTIFVGTITKRNELYLLNRLLKNGNFRIHALKFTDSTVTGLETEWRQSYIIKHELDSGNYSDLIRDTVGGPTINVEKKDGKEIFRMVIEKLKPEKLILPTPDDFIHDNDEQSSSDEDSMNAAVKKSELITKVYPNPFESIVTIELNAESSYLFNVYDMSGKLKKTAERTTDNMQLDLTELNSGQYILKVFSADLRASDELKLIKK
jgi:hypothetical protein